MAAAIFGKGVQCTIGDDAETAAAITTMGGEHINCPVDKTVVDSDRRLVTTPAYMLAGGVLEAYKGISSCVKDVLGFLE